MREQIRKILCATDFSECSNAAVLLGVALAGEMDAMLYACHVIDVPFAGMYGEANPDPVQLERRSTAYARDYITGLIGDAEVDWESVITIGHTADEIARVAEERDVDLVISGSHGRSGLKRLVLGSVTERLMRILPCPLLAVRGTGLDCVRPSAGGRGFSRVLVGCDFSPYSSLAVHYGLSMAQEFQAELHLAHVLEWSKYKDMVASQETVLEAIRRDVRDRMREKLESLVPEEAQHWCTPVTTLLVGRPHEELTKYAVVNDVDLIVMGVRGGGVVETLFVGSNTDRVIRQAPCPVLSVRPLHGE